MERRPIENPKNPFLSSSREYLEGCDPGAPIEVSFDQTKEILSKNDSPDLPFRYSVNPYRGCMHACAYCYARPTHEYLSLGAGTDFDTKIAVKIRAPQLLEASFMRSSWKGETVMFSGVTDCYQPLEATYKLTRQCLLVCARFRNPVAIITKAPLVERDLDVLQELNATARVHVAISCAFFDDETARKVEPFVAAPSRRFRTIEALAKANIPVSVMLGPVIPGLNDDDIPRVLQAAKDAGASGAGWVLLRLPGSVKEVFVERMRTAFPYRAEKIFGRIRDTRDGELYDARFLTRQRGEGQYADMIKTLFDTTAKKLSLTTTRKFDDENSPFRRPEKPQSQLSLFSL